jgi:hypothetical protein
MDNIGIDDFGIDDFGQEEFLGDGNDLLSDFMGEADELLDFVGVNLSNIPLIVLQQSLISPSPILAPRFYLNNSLCPSHNHFTQEYQQCSDQEHPAQAHMFLTCNDRVPPDIAKQQ